MAPKPTTAPQSRIKARGKVISAAERKGGMRAWGEKAGPKEDLVRAPVVHIVGNVFSDHRLLEVRSLVIHTFIARKLMNDPSLLSKPKQNLANWAKRWNQTPHWAREWKKILDRPVAEIAALISEPSEYGAKLRQSSPCAGLLTEEERSRIYDTFRFSGSL